MNTRNPNNFSKRYTATPHERYIGKYYYCMYWRSWDKIIGIEGSCWWHVQAVDVNGKTIGKIRKHCTDIDAGLIADKPFNVEYTP